jgi:hypothetical protein
MHTVVRALRATPPRYPLAGKRLPVKQTRNEKQPREQQHSNSTAVKYGSQEVHRHLPVARVEVVPLVAGTAPIVVRGPVVGLRSTNMLVNLFGVFDASLAK